MSEENTFDHVSVAANAAIESARRAMRRAGADAKTKLKAAMADPFSPHDVLAFENAAEKHQHAARVVAAREAALGKGASK